MVNSEETFFLMMLVTQVLEDAGFPYAIRGGPGAREGYSVFPLANDKEPAILVVNHYKNPNAYTRFLENALNKRFNITHPFSDKTALRVTLKPRNPSDRRVA